MQRMSGNVGLPSAQSPWHQHVCCWETIPKWDVFVALAGFPTINPTIYSDIIPPL
jgi:hypothetical protein